MNEVVTLIEEETLVDQPLASALARVNGEAVAELPTDLYIPPHALEVILEAFEGPLDLLLYLIKRQNLDILEIPITAITEQYVEYIEMIKDLHLELAGEYLVMAAMLAEIKSRLLLPRPPPPTEDREEVDPRAELVRRLQEYERFKKAAEDINELPRLERDIHIFSVEPPVMEIEKLLPELELKELIYALAEVIKRADVLTHHHVQREPLSVRERMTIILDRVRNVNFVDFVDLFGIEEGRMGVVVTFIAILELLKESLIDVVQAEPYAKIHIKAITSELENHEQSHEPR